ncbi:DUF563 domain-containing protein [Nocardioides sp. cx-173]|uniref:glycosyltransferase family 61 protein n=1 Tax=Nocardioides sp. cx-173 TaxID=2898796 RepID=UPI001E3B4A16|nr:glycosyltransferase family 61 protein [Nocardioides sp. cx-173]MCD4526980.1 glycosyltransferase family 61 protein [Nocardioides sp. cx-173]UGB41085.1 glycosyltransferase family 61 protein [Nocardioides sp. cx-173]
MTLDQVRRQLPAGALADRVAVLAGPAEDIPVGDGVRVVDATQTLPALHAALTVDGPYDLVVDLGGGPGLAERLSQLLFHVRPGGVWAARVPQDAGPFLSHLEALRVRHPGGGGTPAERDADALAASIVGVERCEDVVHVRTAADALPKLTHRQVHRLRRRLSGEVTSLFEREGFDWDVAAPAASTAEDWPVPTSYQAPPLSLRAYPEAQCWPRQGVVTARFVAPESSQRLGAGRLHNPSFTDLSPRFVERPPVPRERLEGAWFHLDNQFRGHFGHALSEQVSLLWAWPRVLEEHPDARALVFDNRGNDTVAEWELQLLEAGGVDRDRVHLVRGPVVVERLLAASPMFSRPAHLHPELRSTYDRIGAALAAAATPSVESHERIFLTRRGRRGCHNLDQVEAEAERLGYTIVVPETLPLPEQVRLVREADVIAGLAGSNIFQIAFAGEPKRVVLVGSASYPAHNEFMMSALMGHSLTHVAGTPDVPAPPSGFSLRAFHSDFAIDFAREGVALREALAGD